MKITFYSRDEDRYILQHAYGSLTFKDMAKTLSRSVQSIYQRMRSIFGLPSPCQDHPAIHKDCEACQEQIEIWRQEALKSADDLDYVSAKQRNLYTKEEDLFVIEHAYKDLSFPQISSQLERSKNSAYQRCVAQFGSPTCEEHSQFEKLCEKCNANLKVWEVEARKKIEEIHEEKDPVLTKKQKQVYGILSNYGDVVEHEEIMADLFEFLSDFDYKGRSMENVIPQILKLYLNDYLESYDFRKGICFDLIELFVSIKSDMSLQYDLLEIYKEKFNPDYNQLKDYVYFLLKDLCNLRNLYSTEAVEKLFPLCGLIYKKIYHFYNQAKEGYLPALLYEYAKRTKGVHYIQTYLASLFDTTEVSLRHRIREISKMPKLDKEKTRLFKILDTLTPLQDTKSPEKPAN